MHLEIISDEAVFENSCTRVLDGEVPTTEDLIAYIGIVTLPEHPGVLVPNRCSIRGLQIIMVCIRCAFLHISILKLICCVAVDN